MIRYALKHGEKGDGPWHCIGSPKDPFDFNNAYLMNKTSLDKCIKTNFIRHIGKAGGGTTPKYLPYTLVEVKVEILHEHPSMTAQTT